MDAASVFVKTQKGRDEVRSRAHQLSARERTILIMIDGKRHVTDLLALSPSPNEVEKHLHTLLQAGLIELQSASGESSNADEPNEARIAADSADLEEMEDGDLPASLTTAGLEVSVIESTPPAATCPELEKTRRFIREVAEEALGDEASEFTDTLTRLNDRQDLLNFAQHLRDVLHRMMNGKEADQFLQTVRELAPKA